MPTFSKKVELEVRLTPEDMKHILREYLQNKFELNTSLKSLSIDYKMATNDELYVVVLTAKEETGDFAK